MQLQKQVNNSTVVGLAPIYIHIYNNKHKHIDKWRHTLRRFASHVHIYRRFSGELKTYMKLKCSEAFISMKNEHLYIHIYTYNTYSYIHTSLLQISEHVNICIL